jgi:hypothetical protein
MRVRLRLERVLRQGHASPYLGAEDSIGCSAPDSVSSGPACEFDDLCTHPGVFITVRHDRSPRPSCEIRRSVLEQIPSVPCAGDGQNGLLGSATANPACPCLVPRRRRCGVSRCGPAGVRPALVAQLPWDSHRVARLSPAVQHEAKLCRGRGRNGVSGAGGRGLPVLGAGSG